MAELEQDPRVVVGDCLVCGEPVAYGEALCVVDVGIYWAEMVASTVLSGAVA